MGCLTTNSCCCCFSLRTGGLIMGYVSTIYSAALIIFYFTDIQRFNDIAAKAYEVFHMTGNSFFYSMIALLIVSALLILGIYNKNSLCLLPTVIWSVLAFIAITIFFVMAIISLFSTEKRRQHGDQLIPAIIILILGFAMYWHLTSVIYSLYKQIKAENDHHPGVAYHAGGRDQYKV